MMGTAASLAYYYNEIDMSSCKSYAETPVRKWPLRKLTVDIHFTDAEIYQNHKKGVNAVSG